MTHISLPFIQEKYEELKNKRTDKKKKTVDSEADMMPFKKNSAWELGLPCGWSRGGLIRTQLLSS